MACSYFNKWYAYGRLSKNELKIQTYVLFHEIKMAATYTSTKYNEKILNKNKLATAKKSLIYKEIEDIYKDQKLNILLCNRDTINSVLSLLVYKKDYKKYKKIITAKRNLYEFDYLADEQPGGSTLDFIIRKIKFKFTKTGNNIDRLVVDIQ